MSYRTFLRTAADWKEFARAKKRIVDRGLTADEARRACKNYNDNRTPRQVNAGTKMEFESE